MFSLTIYSSIFDPVRPSRLVVEDNRHDMSGEFLIPTHSSRSKTSSLRILFDRLSISLYGRSNSLVSISINQKVTK
jgi:hypothetical protein